MNSTTPDITGRDHLWLSEAVRAERQGPKPSLWQRRARRLTAPLLRISTGLSGAFLFLTVGIAFTVVALAVPSIPLLPKVDDLSGYLLTLWQVLAALVGLALVILILIVETVQRHSQGDYLWHRFVQHTGLRTTMPAILVSILIVGFQALLLLPGPTIAAEPPGLRNILPLAVLILVGTALSIVWLYDRMFGFLNPRFVQQVVGEFLIDTIRERVSQAVMLNLGGHMLTRRCEELGLEHRPWVTSHEGMRAVRLETHGRVVDVNLLELRRLADRLGPGERPRAIVVVGIHSRVEPGHDTCVLVRPDDLRPEVEHQARACFRVSADQEATDDLDEPFNFLVEQAFGALEAGRSRQVRDALAALREAVRISVLAVHEYGIAFDQDSAPTDVGLGWRPLERPFREYGRILEASVATRDATVLLEVIRWPASVMEFALEEGDHFSFQEAARYLTYLYQMSRGDHPERIRKLLRDRSMRYLREFGSIWIRRRIRSADSATRVKDLEPYAKAVLTAYAQTLKLALDTSDTEFLREALRMFSHVIDVEFLASEFGLHWRDDPRRPRHDELEVPDPLAAARVHLLSGIARWEDELIMALGAWLCRLISGSRIELPFAQAAFMTLTSSFQDFHRLWRAFHDSLSDSEKLPLSDWMMWTGPELQAQFLDTGQQMARFFTVQALTSIPLDMRARSRTLEEVRGSSWARQIITDELRQIRQALAQPQADTSIWVALLKNVDVATRASVLEEVLEAAEADEQERARQRVMAAPLSIAKVQEFTDGVLTAWQRGSWLRALVGGGPGVQVSSDPAPPQIQTMGFWHLVPKEPFVDDSTTLGIDTLGEDFGSGLARGETQALYRGIRRGARRFRLGTKTVPHRVEELIQVMRHRGFAPDAIIVSGRRRGLRLLTSSSDFTRTVERDTHGDLPVEGLFDGVPVYWHQSQNRPEVLLVATGWLGPMTQYVGESGDVPRVTILDYPIEEARQVARERRSEVPLEARSLSDEAVVRYLRERVRLRIEEQFDLQPVSARCASLLRLP